MLGGFGGPAGTGYTELFSCKEGGMLVLDGLGDFI